MHFVTEVAAKLRRSRFPDAPDESMDLLESGPWISQNGPQLHGTLQLNELDMQEDAEIHSN